MKKIIILLIVVLSFNFSFSQQNNNTDKESDVLYFIDLAFNETLSANDLELDYNFYKHVRKDSFACMYWYSTYISKHPEIFKTKTILELLHIMEDVYKLMNKEIGFETPLHFISKSSYSKVSLEINVGGDGYRFIEFKPRSDIKMNYIKNGINSSLDYNWKCCLYADFSIYHVSVIKLKNANELLYTSYKPYKNMTSCSNLDLYKKGIKSNWEKYINISSIIENKETRDQYRALKGIIKEIL